MATVNIAAFTDATKIEVASSSGFGPSSGGPSLLWGQLNSAQKEFVGDIIEYVMGPEERFIPMMDGGEILKIDGQVIVDRGMSPNLMGLNLFVNSFKNQSIAANLTADQINIEVFGPNGLSFLKP